MDQCGCCAHIQMQVNNEPVDPSLTERFPHRYWSISEKKTYCLLPSTPALCIFSQLLPSWDRHPFQTQTP